MQGVDRETTRPTLNRARLHWTRHVRYGVAGLNLAEDQSRSGAAHLCPLVPGLVFASCPHRAVGTIRVRRSSS